ncbi:TonB-dependent receptor [Methylocapsa polymorpha]|uniref:TonB-dependent receptor n=1 Tax=Methylocapsa polymorpha TaxID=3080828 RepID=A0ABZ0HT34_9HYPH|nr:TonB-dependent receptor [Methylocapsa sp. RX1]
MASASVWPLAVQAQQPSETVALPTVDVAGAGPSAQPAPEPILSPETFYQNPKGQVETTIPDSRMEDTKAFSVLDVLRESPGVETKQGNGPRDIGISIRGSGAQVGFGVRNIVIFDDGFPVTQPDGLSRTDLIDPHAYGAIDVIRGPSSALYGNYATGGALNFRMRTGAQIDGIEVGTDAGSFGYLNNYLAYGRKSGDYDLSLFVSNVIGNGPTDTNLFNTQTVNFLGTYAPTPNDRFTFKVINNSLYGDLPNRLSLNQFYANPFQANCYSFGAANAHTAAAASAAAAAAAAAGCGVNNVYVNGYSGLKVPLTAYEAGLHRHDSRSILGLRWEHDLDSDTVWRTQIVADNKNINQPTGATDAVGPEPSLNFMTDLTSRWRLFGFDATHFVGVFANTESSTSWTYNVTPGGNATIGGLTQVVPSQQTNAGIRGREEIKLTDSLTAIGGWGAEYTNINGALTTYTPGATALVIGRTPANNNYYNIAPEGSLVYRPNNDWQIKARVATGYGTPQASNLFVLPSGLAGNNTQLKSQTNLGYDLAVDWTPLPTVKLSVDGFYEFFHNELISQTPGPSPLQAYTFNAPRSEHRGVEVAAEYRFLDGWKAKVAYTYDNQIYTQYYESLAAGTLTSIFNRAGNRIPGVSPNVMTARLGYDVPVGPLKGLGGYAEYYLTDAFYVDNGNLLKVPGSQIVNLNLHYDADVQNTFVQKIGAFFEVRNVFDSTYLAAASNITNTINSVTGKQNPGYAAICPASNAALSCTTGSMYAGMPRTFVGGIGVRF